MKDWLIHLEKLFTLGALMHFSEGIIPLVLSGGASEGDSLAAPSSHPLNAGLFLLIYFITFVLLGLRWKRLFYALSHSAFLAALLLVVLSSFLWSLYPGETLIESIRVVSSSAFGLYFATRYSFDEQLEFLATLFTIVVFVSLVFIVLPPRYGLMGGVHSGAFRGVYVHKNHFGLVMAVSAVIFLMQALYTHQLRYKLLLPLTMLLALLSKSTGALGVMLIALTVFLSFYIYAALRLKALALVPTILLLITATTGGALWFINNLATVAAATGEDLTLTGRTVFWQILIRMIGQRPALGYGYKGFWYGLKGPSKEVIQVANWPVPEAHNGFLEMGLSVGMIGLSLFVLGYVITLVRSLQCLHLDPTVLSIWPLVFLSVLVACNLAESSLMEFGFFWLIYSSIVFALPIKLRKLRAQHRAAQRDRPSPSPSLFPNPS